MTFDNQKVLLKVNEASEFLNEIDEQIKYDEIPVYIVTNSLRCKFIDISKSVL